MLAQPFSRRCYCSPSGVRYRLECGAGRISDPRTGCKVVNANPQPNECMTWSGGCENGFAQGQGVLRWFESGRAANAIRVSCVPGRDGWPWDSLSRRWWPL